MAILVTAGGISHTYLTTGPIFLFLSEVHLRGECPKEHTLGNTMKWEEREDSS